jgi:hypothetical protein
MPLHLRFDLMSRKAEPGEMVAEAGLTEAANAKGVGAQIEVETPEVEGGGDGE